MSLKASYERFLASPNPHSLSESASLHYVTTLTSYTQQGPVIKHLENQNKNVVRKKSEKIIDIVEGQNALAAEIETTLEFISSGGAYLPGLDNFIVDATATLPITHFVNYDRDGKISQIRLNWDQGSLLKQVEVIGTRGKNWPISDGEAQVKLIISGSDSAVANAPALPASRGRPGESGEQSTRNTSPSKRFIKDPHTSLDVFDASQSSENRPSSHSRSDSIAPRESAKPPPREYSEIFAAGHEDLQPSPGGSPNKAHRESVIAPKGAGGRKFENPRLFQADQDFKEPKIYKTNPARYNHFDLGDSQEDDAFQHREGPRKEEKDVPMVARSNKKGASQWGFEDFATPAKPTQRHREQDDVHWSVDNEKEGQKQAGKISQAGKGRKDVDSHFDFLDDGTPVQKRPAQPKARKDAEIHFEFRDEATPAPRRIIARTKAAAGLYADPLDFGDEEGDVPTKPLTSITNSSGRRKNFDSQWDAPDEAPSNGNGAMENKPIGANRMKAVKSMNSEWDTRDQTSDTGKKPTGSKSQARKGLTSSWGFDDE